jgi:hypothetical protein
MKRAPGAIHLSRGKGFSMRRSIFIVAGLVGLLGSGVAVLADPPTATTTAANTADTSSTGAQPNDWNEMICKTMAPTTGTRLGARRICQTRHEWDLQQQEAQRELEKNQQNSNPGFSN